MNQIKVIVSFLILAGIVLVSCSKNEIPSPSVESVKFYTTVNNKFVEVTNPKANVTYTIAIKSNADIIVVWPGGERVTMKKKGTAIDSTDINGNVVLTRSNYYSDYGLLRAQGLKTSLNAEIGWIFSYKYPTVGNSEMNVVATNHGYDTAEYDQRVFLFPVKIE